MPDIFLYAGEINPSDVILSDPTVLRAGGSAVALAALIAAASTMAATLTKATGLAAVMAAASSVAGILSGVNVQPASSSVDSAQAMGRAVNDFNRSLFGLTK